MTILAIDYGTKRFGLAIAHEGIDAVMPFGVVGRDELQKKIEEARPSTILIGLPYDMSGRDTELSARIRAFGVSLADSTGIPVEYVDERFTTALGKRTEGGVSDDEKAAMVMLESYLH